MTTEKHDCFVGNLSFNTTEEQLSEHFSLVGPVKKVRMLNDKDTGRPKGFAFVEYYDPLVALAAIRHLNNTELNGKMLRVGFASNSSLRERAKELGQDIPDGSIGSGTAVHSVVNALPLYEAWDILDASKQLVDTDKVTAKALFETYPQLVFALYEIQRRLGVVTNQTISAPVPPPPQPPAPVMEFIVPDLLGLANPPAPPVPSYPNHYTTLPYGNPVPGQYIDPYMDPSNEGNNMYYSSHPMTSGAYEGGGYDPSGGQGYFVPPPMPPHSGVQFNDPPEKYSWG